MHIENEIRPSSLVRTVSLSADGVREDISFIPSVGSSADAEDQLTPLLLAIAQPLREVASSSISTNEELSEIISRPLPYISPKKKNKIRRVHKQRSNEIRDALLTSLIIPTIIDVEIQQF